MKYEDMGELGSWLTELWPGNQSATLQGRVFPTSTASPDLCQQLARMPFHLGGPQHKRSCHFPYLLPTHRRTTCRLSVCLTPLTFRRKISVVCSLTWGLKQILFREEGDDASNQRSSPGQGDLTPMTDMERRLSFLRQSCYCHC